MSVVYGDFHHLFEGFESFEQVFWPFLDVSSQFEALYGKVEGCEAGRSQVPDARWSVSLVEASRVQAKRKEEEERVKRWGF